MVLIGDSDIWTPVCHPLAFMSPVPDVILPSTTIFVLGLGVGQPCSWNEFERPRVMMPRFAETSRDGALYMKVSAGEQVLARF